MELLEREEIAVIPALPPAAELNKVAESVYKAAHSIVINSPTMFQVAADELQSLQRKLDDLNEKRFSITRPMDAAKKNVMDLFRAPTERCEAGIAFLKGAMLAYTKAEREKAAAAQKQADELARQERLKLEQKARAEQAEVERKAREIAEAEQKAAQAAAAGDHDAVEQAKEEAATRRSEQEHAAASALLAQSVAAVMTAPAVVSAAPKVAGVSTSAPWTAEVVDLLALVKFVAANPQFINFLQANIVPIKQQAKSLQANCKIDGVRVFQEDRLTSRRK